MDSTEKDAADYAEALAWTGRNWTGALPADIVARGRDTVAHRVRGCAFSVLADLDGGGTLDWPVYLSPKGECGIDLTGDLHGLFGDEYAVEVDPEATFIGRVEELAGPSYPADPRTAVGAFLQAFCRLLADQYEIRFIKDDNPPSADFADLLPDAFAMAWKVGA